MFVASQPRCLTKHSGWPWFRSVRLRFVHGTVGAVLGSDSSSLKRLLLFQYCFSRRKVPVPVPVPENLRSEKLQNESSLNSSKLHPILLEFPQISTNFRALFPRKRRPLKIHQQSPPFFNAKSPGNWKKKSQSFLESRQSNKKRFRGFRFLFGFWDKKSGTHKRGVTERGVFAFACQCIVSPQWSDRQQYCHTNATSSPC